jgi:hypothetical protein
MCSACGHGQLRWEASVQGRSAQQADSVWLAADFTLRSAEAELQLLCEDCGWSKAIAAGDWEAR